MSAANALGPVLLNQACPVRRRAHPRQSAAYMSRSDLINPATYMVAGLIISWRWQPQVRDQIVSTGGRYNQ